MKPVTTINRLVIKPGKMDEFIKIHESFARRFGRACEGLNGGRMYRSKDDRIAVLISEFESLEAQQRVVNLPEVRENIKSLQPLVEESNPTQFETAYVYGEPLEVPS